MISDPLAAAMRFLRRSLELTADQFAQTELGWIATTPSLPAVWGLNQMRFRDQVTMTSAMAAADDAFGALPYRHLMFEDEVTARRLEPDLRGPGTKIERELLMALGPELDMPGREAGSIGSARQIVEPSEEEMLTLMQRWIAEEHAYSSQELEQLVEASRREGCAWHERRFGFAATGGRLAAVTKLRSDGNIAQVEDVYTAPEHRRRGYAGALVSHAARTAQLEDHELVFIVADDDDWPKHLYAQIGFEPLGRVWSFQIARQRRR